MLRAGFFRFVPISPALFRFVPICIPSGTNFCTWDFAPPKAEFGPEFWETNFGCPNFGAEFLGRFFLSLFFSSKRGPQKNSPSKIQPRNLEKIFTLHLCRAFWLTFLVFGNAPICSDLFWEQIRTNQGNHFLPTPFCKSPKHFGNLDLFLLLRRQKRCDWEFSIFAAICDFTPRFLAIFLRNPSANLAIFNLRSEFGEEKWGRKKCRRIPNRVGDWQGRVPKRSLPRKTLQNKRFGAPNFWGISPKLFAALRGIHPYLCTPVLPLGQWKRSALQLHCVMFFGMLRSGRSQEAQIPPENQAWDLPRHLQSRKPRNPEKSQKSLPRGVWDPPTSDPEKVGKKSEESRKSLKINYFLDFSDFFPTFLGSGVEGVSGFSAL